jgi:UDP-N-acetylglucosamine--N-acetylmuramyl-(pentapeptide) pyrophosphoryl-undecaprenol N-acetylglucosamine transferase
VSRPPRIGIYAHHHGGGHAARSGAIGAALGDRGAAVTYLSSLPARWPGPGEAIELPLDTDRGPDPGGTPAELHFAPLGSAGLAARMAAIAGWIDSWRPDLLLVDVSVEVAILARLCGVPFAYLRQTGVRDDPPHRLAYSWSAGLLAPFPQWLERRDTAYDIIERTGYVGAVTRFDGDPRPPDGERPRRALVLGGCGAAAEEIAAAAPGWEVLDPRPVDLDLLAGCDVVVAPGGANAVAEVAFARCGLVCVPQPRPFAEQVARGEDLERHGAAVVLWEAPAPGDWPRLLEAARERRVALAAWADGEGAGRAADYLIALARASSRSASSSQSTIPSAASSVSQPLAGQSPQRSR